MRFDSTRTPWLDVPHLIQGRKCPEKGVSAVLVGRERQTRGQMETGRKWEAGRRVHENARRWLWSSWRRVCAGPTPLSTSDRATSDARIKGSRTTSPTPPSERRPLRDPWPQGLPADPAPCRRHLGEVRESASSSLGPPSWKGQQLGRFHRRCGEDWELC